MRIAVPLPVLSAVAALVLITGCSGGGTSAIAPEPVSPSGHLQTLTNPVRHPQLLSGFNSCPETGTIEYAADFSNDVITVYAGNLAGQKPCGRIASSSLLNPSGLYVDIATHDLYVANSSGFDILVFHRGQTTPYDIYTDPTLQHPIDVKLASDGTVIASNLVQRNGNESGSLSTWIVGANGGTFVGNFPMTNDEQGGFIAVRKNGTVYYNDIDLTTLRGALWSLSCPRGACGTQSQVAGVSSNDPAGMAIDSTGDLFMTDTSGLGKTFELPNPHPKKFRLLGHPYGLAMSQSGHHIFIGDWSGPAVREFAYPSGTLIGAIKGGPGGRLLGVAVDP